jgi:hypothetical protein
MDFFDNDGNNDNDGVVIEDDNQNNNNNNQNSNNYNNLDYNNNQQSGNNYFEGGMDMNNMDSGMGMNYQDPQVVTSGQSVVYGGTSGGYGVVEEDPEEVKRREDRQKEENAKREKLVAKQNAEIESKQEIRTKAMDWNDNTNKLYQKNLDSKREFHKNNETDFLQNRDNIKQGKTNPWDVVIGNIDLRESDYKGTKDVSRMKNVIMTRKGDFSNLKMK